MNHQFQMDGGLVVGIPLLLISLIVLLLIVRNATWFKSSSESVPVPSGQTIDQPAPEKAPVTVHHAHDGDSSSFKILGWVGGLLFLAVISYFIAYMYIFWSGNERESISSVRTSVRTEIRTSQVTTVGGRLDVAEALKTAEAARKAIESQVIPFRVSYGELPEWIPIPEGGYDYTITVKDEKPIIAQCARPGSAPPQAERGDHPCYQGVIHNWLRVLAVAPDQVVEGTITFHLRT